MESSAISLCFSMGRRAQPDGELIQKDYLINLIDSPGHIDFSSEVSTASRLCDGAVVLVDAIEGVCSQTVTVLRQTWVERLKPILVINKMDRLITELKMSALEAYSHLTKLVEQVNAVLGSFFQGERMEDDLEWREKIEQRATASSAKSDAAKFDPTAEGSTSDTETGDYEERDDEELYFAPEKNNVIFSSAIDGWALSVGQFAALYEKKLGIRKSILQQCLWGDFYLDPKTKRILASKHLKVRSLKPMFVQLVLDNIWAVYSATVGGDDGKGDPALLEKITKSLSITIPPHIIRSKEPRALLTAVFGAWLPLSTALLVTVIDLLPSPPSAQAVRMEALIEASPGSGYVSAAIRQAMTGFKTSRDEPVVAYVSKMVSVPASDLPQNKRKAGSSLSPEEARDLARKKRAEIEKARKAEEDAAKGGMNGLSSALGEANIGGGHEKPQEEGEQEEPEQLIGFARLYSGTLKVGDEVYVLPPKFSPADPYRDPAPKKVKVTALYLIMGRGLEALESVPAGVIFGIGGLDGHILKSGTLCSQLEGSVNLAGVTTGTEPIVRVALEPKNPADLHKMVHGLKLLEQSDPCARYEQLESGEHVIVTAGELHLERCLKDLRERFARCEIQASEPIVPYRESIVNAIEMAEPKSKDLPRGTVIATTVSKQLSIRLRVRPLPPALTEYLNVHTAVIRHLYAKQKAEDELRQNESGGNDDQGTEEQEDHGDLPFASMSLDNLRKDLKASLAQHDDQKAFWIKAIDRITAFGPRRTGSNLLIDNTQAELCRRFLNGDVSQTDASFSSEQHESATSRAIRPSDFVDRVSHAFQLATGQGPLCHEPLQGIAVFIEDVTVSPPQGEDGASSDALGRLTGEVIKMVRDSIRQGFLDWSPRLLLAMYSCEIQASTEVLGKVYPTITKRRGRILSEALKEGTPFFTISALLPVATSFGFSDDIRKKTSGGAQPQLRFWGFEMLDEDPLWVPFTEEELEDIGVTSDRENVAKMFMDGVRRRKGLLIMGGKKEGAEKARTLKR